MKNAIDYFDEEKRAFESAQKIIDFSSIAGSSGEIGSSSVYDEEK